MGFQWRCARVGRTDHHVWMVTAHVCVLRNHFKSSLSWIREHLPASADNFLSARSALYFRSEEAPDPDLGRRAVDAGQRARARAVDPRTRIPTFNDFLMTMTSLSCSSTGSIEYQRGCLSPSLNANRPPCCKTSDKWGHFKVPYPVRSRGATGVHGRAVSGTETPLAWNDAHKPLLKANKHKGSGIY